MCHTANYFNEISLDDGKNKRRGEYIEEATSYVWLEIDLSFVIDIKALKKLKAKKLKKLSSKTERNQGNGSELHGRQIFPLGQKMRHF